MTPQPATLLPEPVLLRAHDVAYRYEAATNADTAVSGVRLEIRRGDRVGVLGASGAGKSTLFYLLAGLRRPTRGTIEVATHRENVASLAFQFPERQLFAETVRDDVAYGRRESGIAAPEVAARVAAALEEVGLPPAEFLQRAPFHLSGGEMRRVALAGALAQGRPLLLLDEPTLGLDAEGLGRLHGILARLHARGVACWTISHDADFVAATCERVVVLDRGLVVFDAAAAQFWEDPQRAEACGVEVPRALTLAARLRAHGIPVSGAIPSANDIATALAAQFGAGS